jgi:eukaryotic-like serine/threonine-protein kinase
MAEILVGALDGAEGFSKAVVIKRVLARWAHRRDFRAMFVDEARIVSGIRHPNVVSMLELGDDGDALYLVMDYLEGEALHVVSRYLAADGARLPPFVAAHVIAEACAGLHAAHEHVDADGLPQGVVHRDVSPQNVFVCYDGTVRVIDFGVAKAVNRETKTEAGAVKGKFGYMSPEQVGGENVDRRTDLFALGVILWELLTGRRLFQRSNHLETVKATCFEPISTPRETDASVPEVLDRIVMRALERDPDERYRTANEMRRELVNAIHAIAPDAAPGDELARAMQTAFRERIEEKREMLRRIASGGGITHVPKADELDDELDEEPEASPGDKSAVTTRSSSKSRRGGSRALVLAASSVLVLGATAVAIAIAWPDAKPPSSAPPAYVQAPPREAPRAPNEPAPTTVVVRVETIPAGARLVVDGNERGTTPIEIEVPRSETELAIRVERERYRPEEARVRPSRDQHLRFALERELRRARPERPRPPQDTMEAPRIFRVD